MLNDQWPRLTDHWSRLHAPVNTAGAVTQTVLSDPTSTLPAVDTRSGNDFVTHSQCRLSIVDAVTRTMLSDPTSTLLAVDTRSGNDFVTHGTCVLELHFVARQPSRVC